MKKIVTVLFFLLTLLLSLKNVQATELDTSFNSYINELSKYSEKSGSEINLNKIAENLRSGKGIEIDGILGIVLNMLFKEVKSVLVSSVIILIIILISSVVSAIQISEDSAIIKITTFLCYILLAIAIISTFITIIELFKNTCEISSNIMQIVSPFLLGMLIVNGGITSVGIIQPLLLFASSFSSYLVTSVITPLIIFSAVFAVIGNLNEKNTFLRVGAFLRKVSIWVLGIMLTVFLGILSMETSISKDVDSLAVKTTTVAVSNFVPVVGKFFSDSMSSVVGASKIITKVGGYLGIITVIVTSLSPVIKIISAWLAISLISLFSEIIGCDKKIYSILSEIADIYKTISGIIIANSLVFVIAIAIVLNLSSNIVS